MKNQTPVEWLENQIKTSKYFYKLMSDIDIKNTISQPNIIEQAKQMENKNKMQLEFNENELQIIREMAITYNLSLETLLKDHKNLSLKLKVQIEIIKCTYESIIEKTENKLLEL
jgi:hypothetical protein